MDHIARNIGKSMKTADAKGAKTGATAMTATATAKR
jgi:hypothetical protein